MKKLFSLILTLFIFTLSCLEASAFEFTTLTPRDTDMHWAQDSLDELMELGIINGYNGNLNPDQNITRGEFCAIVSRAFNLSSKEEYFFSDVDKNHIFYESICSMKSSAIAGGYPDGSFRPEKSVTREEIAIMISRLWKKDTDVQNSAFSDISSNYPYINEISFVSDSKIMSGYPDGRFMPYGLVTRAQCAVIVQRAMKVYFSKGDEAQVIECANQFLNNHFSDIHTNAIGSALSDSKYISDTYKKALMHGYVVTNSVSNILYPVMESVGPFTVMKADYTVKCTINENPKTYKGTSEIKLITRNGETLVYSHTPGIKKDYPVNLTWEVYSTPPSYDTQGINTVSPTCFRVSSEKRNGEKAWEMYSEDGSGLFFNSSLTEHYVDYAKSKGYEIWAMYKTDFKTATANKLLNSPAMRQYASDILLENILKYSLDGINFDFENMYKSDRGAYTNHVREIALMSHTLGATVSVCVNRFEPTSANWSMCYDRDALEQICDYVALMAYDQFHSASKTPGPVAGMQWTEKCINTTLNEVSPQKLLLGMPYYIRCWEIKNSKAVKSFTVSMETALGYIYEFNIQPEYDARYMLNRYIWTDGKKNYEMWLENADTIRNRVILAKKYGLAGVASWRRGFETADVWYAIYDELFETYRK